MGDSPRESPPFVVVKVALLALLYMFFGGKGRLGASSTSKISSSCRLESGSLSPWWLSCFRLYEG